MALPPQLLKIGKDYTQKIAGYISGDFTSATLQEKQAHCAELRKMAAIAGAGITPLPIPFADIWTVTPVQMAMVQATGNVYGFKITGKNVKAVFATVAGGWIGQQLCLALFKIGMPGAGGFGGAAFVWVWTHAMGKAAEAYFASGMTLTKDELAEIRKKGMQDAPDRPAP